MAQTRESQESLDRVWREDMLAATAGAVLVGGLFLDGWHHINQQNGALGGFFTPWHALLYAGFAASAGCVLFANRHLVHDQVEPRPQYHRYLGLPLRYPFALLGIAIATVGITGDAVWHALFSDEAGVARVISPFHLVLFSGAALVLAAPLRSGWHGDDVYPYKLSLRRLLPPLLSLTLVTAAIAFMFQWLSAFIDWEPSLTLGRVPLSAAQADIKGTLEFASVARVLITNLVLLAPVLVALRRWRLPVGSITLLFTVVAASMATLTEYRLGWTVLAAVAGGLVGDTLLAVFRPSPDRSVAYRLVAGLTPVALWAAWFIVVRVAYDIRWPFDLAAGTVGLCALLSVMLSFLTMPPPSPAAWGAGRD